MGVHDHERDAQNTPVTVGIVVVSSTRTAKTDRSGAAIAEQLMVAGHRLVRTEFVDDDIDAIRAVADDLAPRCRVLLVTGGTGLSARDVTIEALQPTFERRIPGFGELFRMVSFEEVGAAAMLSRADAGVVAGTVIFCLPGSENACRTAMQKLILPNLAHLVHQIDKEAPDSQPIDLQPVDPPAHPSASASAPLPPPPEAEPPAPPAEPRWVAALRDLGGFIVDQGSIELPSALNEIAGVRVVLDRSGQRRPVRFTDGTTGVVLGFPDLVSPGSRALLLRSGSPFGELVALHRLPDAAGVLVRSPSGILGNGDDARAVGLRWTGAVPPFDGVAVAIERGCLYVSIDGDVRSWDGTAAADVGPVEGVLASLAPHWIV